MPKLIKVCCMKERVLILVTFHTTWYKTVESCMLVYCNAKCSEYGKLFFKK